MNTQARPLIMGGPDQAGAMTGNFGPAARVMFPFLWIPATVLAARFQVARNGLQRRTAADGGAVGGDAGAVPVRAAVLARLRRGWRRWRRRRRGRTSRPTFWFAATTGALSQVLATAALLVAMRRAGFAVGTALQQSSLPLAAILGLIVFHDRLERRSLDRRRDHHRRAGRADLAEGRDRASSRSPARRSGWSRASASASR